VGQSYFDRRAEDVGNIVEFGHVNVRVPDQQLATLFYVTGMGFTRDPYLVTGVDNMWINIGTTQFHLPTGSAQVLRGVTVIAVPDLAGLATRLSRVAPMLAGTAFSFAEADGAITVTCPWGNRFRCVSSQVTRLGIVSVELETDLDSADGIVRFYREVMGTAAHLHNGEAVVPVGLQTTLVFRSTGGAQRPYDGAHIQVALADFSGPHRRLLAQGLVTEESNQHQYRFQDIVDPDTRRLLATIEHEVRSMRHPMFARPLVNRDPTITNARFGPGREPLVLGVDPLEL
jgi:catechol 2,3-dioxygenase-like lactoylglutathione lyase family enzyme